MLLWVRQLLISHSQRLRDQRSAYEVPLRTIHKGVCNRYDELAKTAHANQFAVDFLLDQLAQQQQQQQQQQQPVASAADSGEPPAMTITKRPRTSKRPLE